LRHPAPKPTQALRVRLRLTRDIGIGTMARIGKGLLRNRLVGDCERV